MAPVANRARAAVPVAVASAGTVAQVVPVVATTPAGRLRGGGRRARWGRRSRCRRCRWWWRRWPDPPRRRRWWRWRWRRRRRCCRAGWRRWLPVRRAVGRRTPTRSCSGSRRSKAAPRVTVVRAARAVSVATVAEVAVAVPTASRPSSTRRVPVAAAAAVAAGGRGGVGGGGAGRPFRRAHHGRQRRDRGRRLDDPRRYGRKWWLRWCGRSSGGSRLGRRRQARWWWRPRSAGRRVAREHAARRPTAARRSVGGIRATGHARPTRRRSRPEPLVVEWPGRPGRAGDRHDVLTRRAGIMTEPNRSRGASLGHDTVPRSRASLIGAGGNEWELIDVRTESTGEIVARFEGPPPVPATDELRTQLDDAGADLSTIRLELHSQGDRDVRPGRVTVIAGGRRGRPFGRCDVGHVAVRLSSPP